MSTPAATIEQRISIARRNLRTAAAHLGDGRSASASEQLQVESALDDLSRYTALRSEIGSPEAALAESPYAGDDNAFWRDMIASSKGDRAAGHRLSDHRSATADFTAAVEGRAGTSSDFAGLVTPGFLSTLVGTTPRTSAPFTRAVERPLPPKGASVVVSKVTTPITGRTQTPEDNPLTVDDPVAEDVVVPITTEYAAAAVSWQALNRGDLQTMLSVELLTALDAVVETSAIAAVIATSGLTTQTYTDAGPTAGETLRQIAEAMSVATTNRGLLPDLVLCHPRRAFWIMSRTEGSTVGDPIGPVRPGAAPGTIASIFGADLVASPAVPIALGGSTDEDRIIVTRRADQLLFTAPPTSEIVRDKTDGAPVLTATARMVSYIAAGGVLYPSSTVVIGGTGLITPSW